MALDMLNQPTMREMLAVMEAESPDKHEPRIGDGFGATLVLGQIQGFRAALNMLRSFAEPLPVNAEDVETTWGVDLPEPKEK